MVSSRIRPRAGPGFGRTVRQFLLFLLAMAALSSAGLAAFVYWELTTNLPEVEELAYYRPAMATQVFADDGTLVGEFYLEKRYVVPIDRIPAVVRNAFIAAEDEGFYRHGGIDPVSIARALIHNTAAGNRLQGGSTITQQVVKSLLLSPKKSYERKLKEAILALRLEQQLSKDEILYLYLNHLYLGSGAYGVGAAAQQYFGKRIEELTLAEAALLAGLPQAPSRYSPLKHWPRAKARQRYVLERMVQAGFISRAQAEAALLEPLSLASRRGSFIAGPYYVEHVRRWLEERYGETAAYALGLRVQTSLNLRMQAAAEEALREGLKELSERQRYATADGVSPLQGALIALDPATGDVKAMVGGFDFYDSQFNRAVQSTRQPGSAFKPLIFAAALDRDFTPASVIVDAPISLRDNKGYWTPKNYEGRFYGPTTLRDALTFSRNVVTVKLAMRVGIKNLTAYIPRLGIRSPLANNLSLALGSSEVTLLELTSAYGVFAHQGQLAEPRFITRITDSQGHVVDENFPRTEQVISPETAYLITNILQNVIERGTGRRAQALGRPAAGKTGTTNDMNDAWFIGYTPQLLTGVWVGFDEKRSLGKGETGGRIAAPIWASFMERALENQPILDFPVPAGVRCVLIDRYTGQRLAPGEGSGLLECFREGSEPLVRIARRPASDDYGDEVRMEPTEPYPTDVD